MNRPLVIALALVAGGTIAVAPASAGKKPPVTKTFTFTDTTPDPSGNATSGVQNHCTGQLPQEQPHIFKASGPGKIKVEILDSVGDWALQVLDSKGNVLGGDDVDPPGQESATVKIKKAGDVRILPCNMTGGPTANVKYTFTYS